MIGRLKIQKGLVHPFAPSTQSCIFVFAHFFQVSIVSQIQLMSRASLHPEIIQGTFPTYYILHHSSQISSYFTNLDFPETARDIYFPS